MLVTLLSVYCYCVQHSILLQMKLPVQLLVLGALDDDCVYQFCVEI